MKAIIFLRSIYLRWEEPCLMFLVLKRVYRDAAISFLCKCSGLLSFSKEEIAAAQGVFF